jgi:2,6-dihydroxypyridine 3-monooxygenase
VHRYGGSRALVVGGSISGLTAALLLRELGFAVEVFERALRPLEHRGGGIVLQRITMKWFRRRAQRRAGSPTSARAAPASRYLGKGNAIVHDEPVEWLFTSWGTIYRALLGDFASSTSTSVSSARAGACRVPECGRGA